jgi:hypothetical protein
VALLAILATIAVGNAALAQTGSKADTAPTPNTKTFSLDDSSQLAGPSNPEVEHWNVLPLANNHLIPSKPLLGETAEFPAYTRELIQVKWRARDPIDLYVIRPVNTPSPPVVLLLYGYPTDTDRFRNDALCQAIVKHGFAAVGFVSALTGQRYHDRPMKEWFFNQLPESIGASVHDVQMILNYLTERKDFDMNRVGIYGQGSGATIAILSAAVDPRIKAVDLLDPWGDWNDWIPNSVLIPEHERAAFLTPEFLGSIALFDPVIFLPQLTTRPVRLQQTAFSHVTSEKARIHILASAPPASTKVEYKTVEEYKAAGASDGRVFDWLQHALAIP